MEPKMHRLPDEDSANACTLMLILRIALAGVVAMAPLDAVRAQSLTFSSGIDPATAHGLIAQSLGSFKKYGLNVSVKKFSSAAAGVRTIYAGESDFGVAGDMNIVSPAAQGSTAVRVVGQLRRGLRGYGAAVVSEEIKRPSDLRGKKIGLLQGSPVSHLFFELYTKHHGVTGVERVWLTPQEQLIAFSRGDIDGLFVFSPWWQQAKNVRRNAHVLAYDHDDNILSTSIVVVIHERLIATPNTVTALLRALREADDYLNTNRSGTVEILRKQINLNPDVINSILDSLEQRLTVDDVLIKNLCQSYNFLRADRKIPDGKEPDWGNLVLGQYLKEVAPERVSITMPIQCR